jgi:hypothetical protein
MVESNNVAINRGRMLLFGGAIQLLGCVEICEGLIGQLLEVLRAILGELKESVPTCIINLNALARA